MIQIIKRKEGEESVVTSFGSGRPQISYNSDGRLVIRIIEDDGEDKLIVLDNKTSKTMIRFFHDLFSLNNLPF